MRLSAIALVSSLALLSSLGLAACYGDDQGGGGPPPEADGGQPDAQDGAARPDGSVRVPDAGDGGMQSAMDATVDAPADAGQADAHDASESMDASDGGAADASDDADGGQVGDASDASDDAPEAGTISTDCMDFSGQYQENDDVLTLTRPNCGSLTWVRAPAFDGTPGYTHVYTTDGVTRATTDETGNAIEETATVDASAMHVHRTSAAGLDEYQTVHWTTTPCTLLDPQGIYMERDTANAAGQQTDCEFWNYDDPCPYPTRTCVANPADKCQTDIATDTNNCGACGVVCGTPNTTSVACVNNACQLDCAAGFANCTGALSDGCETDLTTVSNCGSCGNVCGSAGTTSSTCTNGACALVCDATHQNCDGQASNGCETDITQSPWACGSCGVDCGGALCASSQCVAQGRTLVSGISDSTMWPVDLTLGVDGTYVYYRDAFTGALFAVDKVNGGAPITIVQLQSGDWVAAGDGSVYYTSQSTPYTITRWVGPSSPTQQVATLTGTPMGMYADTAGVVWSDVVESGDGGAQGYRDSTVRGWAPGDAAPHDIYVATEQMGGLTVGAMKGDDVVGLINGGVTILRISRAMGTAQTIYVNPQGYGGYWSGYILESTVYLYGSYSYWTVPLTGGTPVNWWTTGNNVFTPGSDGTSLFAADATQTYANVEQSRSPRPPTPRPSRWPTGRPIESRPTTHIPARRSRWTRRQSTSTTPRSCRFAPSRGEISGSDHPMGGRYRMSWLRGETSHAAARERACTARPSTTEVKLL